MYVLFCAACGSAAAIQESTGGDWKRYTLPNQPISVEMPCSMTETVPNLLPVDIQIACHKHGWIYAIALDERSIEEVEGSIASQSKYSVSRLNVAGSAKAISVLPKKVGAPKGERHVFVGMPNGKTAWIVHLASSIKPSMKDASQLPIEEADIERFFDSIEITS